MRARDGLALWHCGLVQVRNRIVFFFFFQAEDGIRDSSVTGVQTCALPICLTYITIGLLGTLPSASLVQLASNTHVSLEVVGGMFTISAIGGMLGVVLSGFLIRSIRPKYLLMLGLFFVGAGSTTIVLTSSFPVLLLGQMVIGLAFGFVDISLDTIVTLAFQAALNSDLNTIHVLFGLRPLLGPFILAFGLHFFNSLEFSYFIAAGVAAITILLVLL